jgi:hypothetical protein
LDIVTANRDQFALRLQNTAADGWSSLKMADGAGHNSSISFHYGQSPFYGEVPSSTIGFYVPGGDFFELRDDRLGAICNAPMRATVFVETSDRNRKQAVEPVNPGAMLQSVVSLPISTWAFTNAANTRHLGPMAQDFRATFGLGDDDTTISARDVGGVALAAIQGLNQKLEAENQAVRSALAAKDAKVAELEQRLAALEKFIKQQTK